MIRSTLLVVGLLVCIAGCAGGQGARAQSVAGGSLYTCKQTGYQCGGTCPDQQRCCFVGQNNCSCVIDPKDCKN